MNKKDDLYICECGRQFKSLKSLISHGGHCDLYKSHKKISKYKYDDIYRCECGRKFTNSQSLNAHFSHCDIHHEMCGTERKLRTQEIEHKMSGWDDKTQEEIKVYYNKSGEIIRQKYKSGELIAYWLNDNVDKTEARKKLSETITKLREEGKTYCRGSMGYYKNIHCDSSWELAFLVYCIDHNIPIKRCNIRLKYIYKGTQHTYTPDFIINESELIEIKGFKDSRWEEKKKCCLENNIKIINKEDIKPYIKYVKEKYGKDFIKLYKE